MSHTMQQFGQAVYSIQSQMTHVRDTIEQEKTNFYGDDLIFLQSVELCMSGYLLAVQVPLDNERKRLNNGMSTEPHPWNEPGC